MAAECLRRAGWRIVARNLRTRQGEIDLLVRRRRTWAAVEVKARRDHPAPERLVDAPRLQRLARALEALAADLRPRPRWLRIDVVAVRFCGAAPREVLHVPAVRTVQGGPRGRGRPGAAQAKCYAWPAHVPRPARPHRMPTLVEQMIPRRKLLLMGSETVLFTGILFVGSSLPPLASIPLEDVPLVPDLLRAVATCFTISLICQTSLSYNDLYDWRTAQNRAELPNRMLHACGYALVMLALLVLLLPGLFHFPTLDAAGQTWKLIGMLLVAFTVVLGFRNAFHWFFYKWRFGERVLVVGVAPEAQDLARMIGANPLAGYELMGLVRETDEPVPAPDLDAPPHSRVLGSLRDLPGICAREGVARVVVSLRERRGRVPVEELLTCRMAGITVEERETMYERLTGKLAVESMRPSYLIFGSGFARDPVTLALKRVLDIGASFTGLCLSLPIGMLAAAAVKLTSRGPVFFTQERVGQDGATFRLVKFRTMRADAEKESGPVWAQVNDDRITPIGRFLRLTRIDEIPQFLNILAGQMSFVGPRPERPHFVEQLTRELPFYPLRHTIKPGLTGWAQVCHQYGASTEDALEKLRYDLYYIKNVSLVFDLNIMVRTIGVILLGKGAR